MYQYRTPPEVVTDGLYTLTQVVDKTGIPLSLLLRYKKLYADRIPTQGREPRLRFPEEAIAVFQEIHRTESAARQGNPFSGRRLMSLTAQRMAAQRVDEETAAEAERQETAAGARADEPAPAELPAAEAPIAKATVAEAPTTDTATAEPAKGETPAAAAGVVDARPAETAQTDEAPTREVPVAKRNSPRKPSTTVETAAAQEASPQARRIVPARAATAAGEAPAELLTLKEIEARTGISYPTLIRYTRLHLDRIPHHGKGRARRYPPEAAAVFLTLRGRTRRGRPPSRPIPAASAAAFAGVKTTIASGGSTEAEAPQAAPTAAEARQPESATAPSNGRTPSGGAGSAGLADRLRALEASQERLEQEIRWLLRELEAPVSGTAKAG